MTSVLLKNGTFGRIKDVTVKGQHLLNLMELVAGKLKIEWVIWKKLNQGKQLHSGLIFISEKSRAKNVNV